MGVLVQSNRAYNVASVAYGSNVTAGNLLLVAVGAFSDTATINTPTDTRSTPYVQAGTLLRTTDSQSPGGPMLGVYYGIAPSSGANTVTPTFAVATPIDPEFKVYECSGVHATTPLNQTNGATGNGSPAATGNITTTQPGLIFKFLMEWLWAADHNQAVGTPTTGWTEIHETTTGSDAAWRNETGTGTFNGGFSWTGDVRLWSCRIVALADVGGGATFTQEGYRWRNDDGSETTATWRVAQDTPL